MAEQENAPVQSGDTLDLELEVRYGDDLGGPVAVLKSPAGTGRASMGPSFSPQTIAGWFDRLQDTILSSGGRRRKKRAQRAQDIQEFGQWLFDAAFAGESRALFDRHRRQAEEQDQRLQLKLRIQPPELAALPWEFLYDARREEYLCLSSEVSLVRQPVGTQPGSPPDVKPAPVRILGVVAIPSDSASEARHHKDRLEAATKHLRTSGLVELEWVEGTTWRSVQSAILRRQWHVLYFVGDGGFDPQTKEGYLALLDVQGRSYHLGSGRLGWTLASHGSPPFVWLERYEGTGDDQSDPFSGIAADLVGRGIATVLTVPYPMDQTAGVTFARAFYGAVCQALPIDRAITQARQAIRVESSEAIAWGFPALHTHAPAFCLFDHASFVEAALTRGDEAFQHDNLERAIRQYSLAVEMGAGAVAQEKKGSAEAAHQVLADAQNRLDSLSGSPETQAAALSAVLADLEGLQQQLPESRSVQVVLQRAREQADALSDRLWQDGRRLMEQGGWTRGLRRSRMQKSVLLLTAAAQLDALDSPALQEDLSLAKARLEQLGGTLPAESESRSRWFVYGIVAVIVVLGLVLAALLVFGGGSSDQAGMTPSPAIMASSVVASQDTTQVPTETSMAAPTQQLSATATNTAQVQSSTTAGPESSPTLPPTSSPVAAATATVLSSPTPRPSATSAPTRTPTEVPAETATEAVTATPIPVRATNTPRPLPTATATPGIIYAAPRLIQPQDVVYLSQYSGNLYTMRWTWEGTLKEDEWFDVRIWRAGMPHYGIAWTKDTEYVYDICLQGSGNYYWSIAIVRGEDGQWLGDLSREAEPRRFSSYRSDSWCQDRGRLVIGGEQ
ncbi:MAG: CHAT domain-containing protein [Anaerolineae bacterium]|jgi:hypothetical protein